MAEAATSLGALFCGVGVIGTHPTAQWRIAALWSTSPQGPDELLLVSLAIHQGDPQCLSSGLLGKDLGSAHR